MTGIWKSERLIVAMKRVMIVERRGRRVNERKRETMSVHSNDGIKTGLTKLDRLGELSASRSDMVFNNLGHLINNDLLKEIYNSLNGNKAVGVDKVTKEDYGVNLEENINSLLLRIRRGTYKPKPARITEIPKEDGSTRPLAISCFEDKLVQLAVSTILGRIYEPLFLDFSYGFRPGLSGHDAIKSLNKATFKNWNGAVVEIDIKQYFNRIPHKEIMHFLNQKISDKRFLRLISILVTMPIMEGKVATINTIGCPQGSIVTPPTMLRKRIVSPWKQTLVNAKYHMDLLLVNVNALDQRSDQLASAPPI